MVAPGIYVQVVEYKNCLMFSLLFHYFMDILELHVLDLIKVGSTSSSNGSSG